jgi:hypothetical protein
MASKLPILHSSVMSRSFPGYPLFGTVGGMVVRAQFRQGRDAHRAYAGVAADKKPPLAIPKAIATGLRVLTIGGLLAVPRPGIGADANPVIALVDVAAGASVVQSARTTPGLAKWNPFMCPGEPYRTVYQSSLAVRAGDILWIHGEVEATNDLRTGAGRWQNALLRTRPLSDGLKIDHRHNIPPQYMVSPQWL